MRRLARPAPEPVELDIRPEFIPAAELILGRPVVAAEPEPVYPEEAYERLAVGLKRYAAGPAPVRVTEPTDSAPLAVELAAQRDDVVSAPAPQVWRTLRQPSVVETPAPTTSRP